MNVCTPQNERGRYEVRYRLPISEVFETAELAELADLDSLREFVAGRNGAPDDPTRRGAVAARRDSRQRQRASQIDAHELDLEWLSNVRAATEKALDTLVDEFVADPYLNRVEHSIHVRLVRLLLDHAVISRREFLATGEQVQLVHKEWPAVRPMTDGPRSPRGLFDIAILAPDQVRQSWSRALQNRPDQRASRGGGRVGLRLQAPR